MPCRETSGDASTKTWCESTLPQCFCCRGEIPCGVLLNNGSVLLVIAGHNAHTEDLPKSNTLARGCQSSALPSHAYCEGIPCAACGKLCTTCIAQPGILAQDVHCMRQASVRKALSMRVATLSGLFLRILAI